MEKIGLHIANDHENGEVRTMTTSPENPIALAVAVANEPELGAELGAEAAAWVRVSLRNYMRGDGTLEQCFGLARESRLRTRNRATVVAAAIIDDGRGLSPWALSGLLEQAIRRFEVRYGLAAKAGLPIKDGMTNLDSAILNIFKSGAKPLRSQFRIYKILA